MLGQSARQSAHAAAKVKGGRCFINAKTNLGGVAKHCFNLFAACGEKVFSRPLAVPLSGIDAYGPQRIGLRQSLSVSLQLFE